MLTPSCSNTEIAGKSDMTSGSSQCTLLNILQIRFSNGNKLGTIPSPPAKSAQRTAENDSKEPTPIVQK